MSDVPNQRIYEWGYCDACDDLHACSDEREGPPEWDFDFIDADLDHDTPTPVFIGIPAFIPTEPTTVTNGSANEHFHAKWEDMKARRGVASSPNTQPLADELAYRMARGEPWVLDWPDGSVGEDRELLARVVVALREADLKVTIAYEAGMGDAKIIEPLLADAYLPCCENEGFNDHLGNPLSDDNQRCGECPNCRLDQLRGNDE